MGRKVICKTIMLLFNFSGLYGEKRIQVSYYSYGNIWFCCHFDIVRLREDMDTLLKSRIGKEGIYV